ncbi:MAG TPA: hypothetical protein DCQ04_14750 [Actinobacteria bacterium]|nr:hypothetical protein [Actinomycetota bacterium]
MGMTIQSTDSAAVKRTRRNAFGYSVSVDADNRMPRLTWFMAAGMLLAGVFAIVGLPPFDLPMPTWAFGVVTPTCGLTRASTALAKGQFGVAWAFNPAAYVLALVAVATAVRFVYGLVTKRWINVSVRPTRLFWVCLGVFVIVWWGN